jgi:hypothetical protein
VLTLVSSASLVSDKGPFPANTRVGAKDHFGVLSPFRTKFVFVFNVGVWVLPTLAEVLVV